MTASIVICRMCKVPLSGKDQFLGHQILSHELRIEDAESAWLSAHGIHSRIQNGGIAA